MQKAVILGLIVGFLFPSVLNAACLIRDCPKEKIICPENTFMGDDGQCYDCKDEKDIQVLCIGYNALERRCPDRKRTSCGGSVPECAPYAELFGNECKRKCEDGYTRDATGHCCNGNICIYEIF